LNKQIVISVLSQDRPGIIADVTNVIYDLKGDLADMSQSVLDGFFSMIIIATFNDSVSTENIRHQLQNIKSSTELSCIVKETGDSHPSSPDISIRKDDIYVVTAQGKNRTGLVAALGNFCRERNINILGYQTKLKGDKYSMMLDISLPEDLSPDQVHDQLSETTEKLGLKVVMQHKRLFETVNEISLYQGK
jgi:glycine cleavage system transcriptional repressor